MENLVVAEARTPRHIDDVCRWISLASVGLVLLLAGVYLLLALPANDDFIRATQPWVRGGVWNYVMSVISCRFSN